MICARCDLRIHPAEPYIRHENYAPTGAGDTVFRHLYPCKPAQTQTSPVSRQGPTREG